MLGIEWLSVLCQPRLTFIQVDELMMIMGFSPLKLTGTKTSVSCRGKSLFRSSSCSKQSLSVGADMMTILCQRNVVTSANRMTLSC